MSDISNTYISELYLESMKLEKSSREFGRLILEVATLSNPILAFLVLPINFISGFVRLIPPEHFIYRDTLEENLELFVGVAHNLVTQPSETCTSMKDFLDQGEDFFKYEAFRVLSKNAFLSASLMSCLLLQPSVSVPCYLGLRFICYYFGKIVDNIAQEHHFNYDETMEAISNHLKM